MAIARAPDGIAHGTRTVPSGARCAGRRIRRGVRNLLNFHVLRAVCMLDIALQPGVERRVVTKYRLQAVRE